MGNKPTVEYEEREKLDSELERAIGDIIAAEAEARSIIEQAEAAVKSVQLDGSAQERSFRDMCTKRAAAEREAKIAAAREKARRECAEIVARAEKAGNELLDSKRSAIDKIAAQLFATLGSK